MNLNVTYDTLCSLFNKLMADQYSFVDLTQAERTLWLSWTVVAEVNNGGLHQFFFNHSGERALETIDALAGVAAMELAGALRAAVACFPDDNVSSDVMTRRSQLESIDADAFQQFDQVYFSRGDTLDELLITYVKSNMLNTILPDFIRDASSKADDLFREKHDQGVVDLLLPFESHLNGVTLGKLKISLKKLVGEFNS